MIEEITAEKIEQEYEHWPASKFKDPIDVDNGIRLQRTPADIATRWWSKKWLDIIASFGLGVRLQRAMMYASRGQVLKIEIENGLVKANVQGSDPEPYRVTIAVRQIPKAIWTSILHELGQDSRFGILLTTAALPPEDELEAVFRNSGALLFPDRQGELQTKCSCPDWSNPCKHVAAVYLLLAAEFDKDPFLIFKLRGLSHDELFSYLAGKDDGLKQTAGASAASLDNESYSSTASAANLLTDSDNAAATAIIESSPAVSLFDRDRYWRFSLPAEQVLGQWQPASECASLAESLGDFPFWQGREHLLPVLKQVYGEATQQAVEMLCLQESAEYEPA